MLSIQGDHLAVESNSGRNALLYLDGTLNLVLPSLPVNELEIKRDLNCKLISNCDFDWLGERCSMGTNDRGWWRDLIVLLVEKA